MSRAILEVEAEGVAILCCEALGMDGSEYARGYLQYFLKNDYLMDAMAQRIIKTVHRILQAGRAPGDQAAGNETVTALAKSAVPHGVMRE